MTFDLESAFRTVRLLRRLGLGHQMLRNCKKKILKRTPHPRQMLSRVSFSTAQFRMCTLSFFPSLRKIFFFTFWYFGGQTLYRYHWEKYSLALSFFQIYFSLLFDATSFVNNYTVHQENMNLSFEADRKRTVKSTNRKLPCCL